MLTTICMFRPYIDTKKKIIIPWSKHANLIENKFANRKLEKRGVVRATSVCASDVILLS